MKYVKFAVQVSIALLRRLSLVVFAALAVGLVVTTALSAFGVIPWVTLPLEWNGAAVPEAGQYAQIILTALAVSLCFFLPTNWRILRLESSHRKFEISVDDITRAYHAAHTADRAGVFRTGDTFDEMRDRMVHLRDHAELAKLEPELLDLAAKMSYVSRDLADAYSDDRMARARSFLKERDFEISRFKERLAHATAIQSEFSNWINRIELDENLARVQMERLVDELETMLPELNSPTPPTTPPAAVVQNGKVTQLSKRAE